jgi:Fe-S-cluster containining protein
MFPCTGCGLCCQHISDVEELKDYDLGNGVCKYFNEFSKECTIYEIRPEICRVDEIFEKRYKDSLSKRDFYIENAKVCNILQDKYSFDKSYRVNIKEI